MKFGKSLLSLILLIGVVACNSEAQLNAGAPLDLSSAINEPKDLPNHKKYRDFIKTPLRDLKVTEEMSLVDNFSDVLRYHRVHTKGKARENDGMVAFYSSKINFETCVPSLSRTFAVDENNAPNIGTYTNFCHNMVAHRFLVNPEKNVGDYKAIIQYWLDNKTLESVNKTQRGFGQSSNDYAYSVSTNVAKVMAHFALYHPLYGFSKEEMQNIEEMFETFAKTYDYYRGVANGGVYFTKLCNLKNPTVPPGTNDHCGSYNTRMAVGATLLGIELGNQVIFDKGIQHVEVMLATFDSNKMYTSQIWRHDGLSYADQVNPAIDQLDYAFDKAFGIDFANLKNAHGVTPGEVYQHMWNVANDPTLLLPYMNYKKRLDPQFYANTNDYDGQDMFKVIRDIETGQKKPEYIWQAFNERRYILSAPALAREFQPELWRKWKNRVRFGDYDYGGHITGFSPLVLRNSTQRF